MQVALDEMLSNIVKYAWPDGGPHEVQIRMEVDGARMEIVLRTIRYPEQSCNTLPSRGANVDHAMPNSIVICSESQSLLVGSAKGFQQEKRR